MLYFYGDIGTQSNYRASIESYILLEIEIGLTTTPNRIALNLQWLLMLLIGDRSINLLSGEICMTIQVETLAVWL